MKTTFEAFAARKTAEADAAIIAPLVTERDRANGGLIAIGNAWSHALFDGPFYMSPLPTDGAPAASLVFVRSREGNTVARNPSMLGGGDVDKHLIYEGLSRVAADAVLGGAATIRGGDLVLSIWRRELVQLRAALGLPRHPIQVVATLRGAPLEEGLLFNVPELPVIVITVARGAEAMRHALAARPWVTSIVMETPHDLPLAFHRLREHGINRLSCIGGRTLAGQLIDAGLIQDLYLTTTDKSAGEPNTPFYSRPLGGDARLKPSGDVREVVRKHGTGPNVGVIFEHLAVRSG
jgi:5-amino-6-(5-phosphoribosylamino)uracil reductase